MREEFRLTNKFGEVLVGDHVRSQDNNRVILVITGYGASRKGGAKILSDILIEQGHNCMILDRSGCGESQGDVSIKTVGDWLEETKQLVAYARQIGYQHISLLGTSTGGGIALEIAAEDSIDRVLVRAPACDYEEIRLLQFGEEGIEKARRKGFFDGNKHKISFASYEESLSHTVYDRLNKIKAPTLIIHGSDDSVVPLSQSKRAVELIPDATLLVIEGGDHSTGVDGDHSELQQAVIDWFSK